MANASYITQRRRPQHSVRQTAAAAEVSPEPADAKTPFKRWHLWVMFGTGWPSILLFWLSTATALPVSTRGLSLTLGWLFCGSWWVSTVSGLLAGSVPKQQAAAYNANLIMALAGSCTGCMAVTWYAYYHWPMLYVAALAMAFLLMHVIRSLVGDDSDTAADKELSRTDATLTQPFSPTVALDRASALTRSLSAPEAATQRLLEHAATLAAQEQAQASSPQEHCAESTATAFPQPPAAAAEAATSSTLPDPELRHLQAAAEPPLMQPTLHQALAAGLVALMPVDHAGAAAVGPQQLVTFDQAAAAGVVLTGPLYIAQPTGGATPAAGFVLVPAGNIAVTPPQPVMPAAALEPSRVHVDQPVIGHSAAQATQTAALARIRVPRPGMGEAFTAGLSLEEAAVTAGLLHR